MDDTEAGAPNEQHEAFSIFLPLSLTLSPFHVPGDIREFLLFAITHTKVARYATLLSSSFYCSLLFTVVS